MRLLLSYLVPCNTFFVFVLTSLLQLLTFSYHRNFVSSFSPPHAQRARRGNCITQSKNFVRRKRSIKMSSNNVQGEVVGQMLGGLVFLKTKMRNELVEFYTEKIGMRKWLDQPNISILAHGNMILGFHQPEGSDFTPDIQGMYTFVYPARREVDKMFELLRETADDAPRNNERYKIYQFFARDPEGRALEFQAFLHPLDIVSSAVDSTQEE